MKSRTEILVPFAAIQAVPIAVIAWYRLQRYAWYRYSAIVTLLNHKPSCTILRHYDVYLQSKCITLQLSAYGTDSNDSPYGQSAESTV